MDGLSLVVTWSESFSLQGEELSYVIFITGSDKLIRNDEVNVNETEYKYVFSEPVGEMDCTQYIMFTAFSENGYSRSKANVSEWKNIPTGTAHNTENPYTKYTKYHYYVHIIILLASCSSWALVKNSGSAPEYNNYYMILIFFLDTMVAKLSVILFTISAYYLRCIL